MRHLLVVPVLLTLTSVSAAGEVRYIYDDLDRLIGAIDPAGNSAQNDAAVIRDLGKGVNLRRRTR